MRAASVCSCCALILALAGCGASDDAGRTVPVRGQVSYAGRRLATGVVIFRPDARRGNACKYEARGSIDAEGNYQLFTGAGRKLKEGAPIGWYRVAVVSVQAAEAKQAPVQGHMPPPPKSLIPLNYNDPDHSGISIQVTESAAPGAYNITVAP
jgi:hypothetical protein